MVFQSKSVSIFLLFLGCLKLTSTGLLQPLYNSTCNTQMNQQACQYKGKQESPYFVALLAMLK